MIASGHEPLHVGKRSLPDSSICGGLYQFRSPLTYRCERGLILTTIETADEY